MTNDAIIKYVQFVFGGLSTKIQIATKTAEILIGRYKL
jgi:hypothetical protein